MRKRLRKKLRRAEFTELVFGVRYVLMSGLAMQAADDFLDRFPVGSRTTISGRSTF